MERYLEKAEYWLGAAAAVLLVLLGIFGVFDFLVDAVALLRPPKSFETPAVTSLIDTVLWVFIVIELLQISLAYVRRQRVIPIVFEATLVAVLRKIILMGAESIDFNKATALAELTIAVGITWFLIERKCTTSK